MKRGCRKIHRSEKLEGNGFDGRGVNVKEDVLMRRERYIDWGDERNKKMIGKGK